MTVENLNQHQPRLFEMEPEDKPVETPQREEVLPEQKEAPYDDEWYKKIKLGNVVPSARGLPTGDQD